MGVRPLANSVDHRGPPVNSVVNLADRETRTNVDPDPAVGSASGPSRGNRLAYDSDKSTTEFTKDHGDPRRFFALESGALLESVQDRQYTTCSDGRCASPPTSPAFMIRAAA